MNEDGLWILLSFPKESLLMKVQRKMRLPVGIGRQVARDRFQLNKRKSRKLKLKLKLKKIIFLYKTTLDLDRKMDAIGYPDHYKI
jgi:hypothetical protein